MDRKFAVGKKIKIGEQIFTWFFQTGTGRQDNFRERDRQTSRYTSDQMHRQWNAISTKRDKQDNLEEAIMTTKEILNIEKEEIIMDIDKEDTIVDTTNIEEKTVTGITNEKITITTVIEDMEKMNLKDDNLTIECQDNNTTTPTRTIITKEDTRETEIATIDNRTGATSETATTKKVDASDQILQTDIQEVSRDEEIGTCKDKESQYYKEITI
ncbi:hypothetical protein RhiirB3_456767 [Rhizophagus irregularis]|nr:hypothetical protein RhiirB3_456767 [Rhizophagus irregularis]